VAELSLEVVEGPDAGRRVELTGPLRIGRGADAGLVLGDHLVSRAHAQVTPSGASAVVEDLGSRNGTFLNGDQVHGRAPLSPGDQLLVGVTVVELRTAAQVARRPSAVRQVPPPLAVPARAPDYVPEDLVDAELSATDRAPAGGHELDRLLDRRVKRQARTAPLAVFVLVVLVLLVWMAIR
jgi:pSer/pThr/pTyr-binding forkhead associated (FHA) protein